MTSPALQEIIALLGCPAAGNPAQYLCERALAEAGLDWRFLTLEVAHDRIAAALAGIDAMGFRGCILSGPLRGLATAHVAAVSPTATFSRAVSLVERQPTGPGSPGRSTRTLACRRGQPARLQPHARRCDGAGGSPGRRRRRACHRAALAG